MIHVGSVIRAYVAPLIRLILLGVYPFSDREWCRMSLNVGQYNPHPTPDDSLVNVSHSIFHGEQSRMNSDSSQP